MNRARKDRAGIVGLGVAACAACCAGPIIALIGGIAALGAISAVFVGAVALVAAALIGGMVLLTRRRRGRAIACPAPFATAVTVDGPRRRVRQT
jgi:hypothetical protein